MKVKCYEGTSKGSGKGKKKIKIQQQKNAKIVK